MSIEKQAFESRVLELLGPLQGVAMRLTCDETAAEDLVAEAVARAWKSRESLDEVEAFRAWIFRILHNTFISEIRYARCRPWMNAANCEEMEDEDASFSLFEQMHQPFLLWFSNPEQEFLDGVLRDDLEQALATLPPHYRVVVVLSDLEEFSYQEIAATLEIPVGTVRSRLARARSALQKVLWRQAQEHGLRAADAPEETPDPGTDGRSGGKIGIEGKGAKR